MTDDIMAERERWLPVVGFEGYYEVSDRGRVRSVDRVITYRTGTSTLTKGKLLQGGITDGYRRFGLSRGNRRTYVKLHQLMLTAFVGPCPDGMVGCHWDDDRLNDRLDNLRWDTQSANSQDRVRNNGGRRHYRNGPATHCKHGHEFTPSNTRATPRQRYCRECARRRDAAYRAKRKDRVND